MTLLKIYILWRDNQIFGKVMFFTNQKTSVSLLLKHRTLGLIEHL